MGIRQIKPGGNEARKAPQGYMEYLPHALKAQQSGAPGCARVAGARSVFAALF
jgi:hypothetical protein